MRRPLVALLAAGCSVLGAAPLHHYTFFGQDRAKLNAPSFLDSKVFEGAQVTYSWRQLEPAQNTYDFTAVQDDLVLLTAHGKKLFLQLQDVTFSPARINVPRYLLQDRRYHGGAARQYDFQDDDESHAAAAGWMARRWDPAVRERFHALLNALGEQFDGRIEGINLAETAFSVGRTGRLFPAGFSFELYRDGILANMRALKRAFPKSVTIQYANFMPGEWLPADDHGYLRAVYQAARELHVGVGGPDLLPYKKGQMSHSYPLIRDSAGVVPIGIAVQDGDYGSIAEQVRFATEYLKADYIFWCTEEPFYSRQLIPFLNSPR